MLVQVPHPWKQVDVFALLPRTILAFIQSESQILVTWPLAPPSFAYLAHTQTAVWVREWRHFLSRPLARPSCLQWEAVRACKWRHWGPASCHSPGHCHFVLRFLSDFPRFLHHSGLDWFMPSKSMGKCISDFPCFFTAALSDWFTHSKSTGNFPYMARRAGFDILSSLHPSEPFAYQKGEYFSQHWNNAAWHITNVEINARRFQKHIF